MVARSRTTGPFPRWGALDRPRHAEVLEGWTAGKRLPRGHVPFVLGFFTDGPAPEAVRLALQGLWPTLVSGSTAGR